jgi:hypothetical protein
VSVEWDRCDDRWPFATRVLDYFCELDDKQPGKPKTTLREVLNHTSSDLFGLEVELAAARSALTDAYAATTMDEMLDRLDEALAITLTRRVSQ